MGLMNFDLDIFYDYQLKIFIHDKAHQLPICTLATTLIGLAIIEGDVAALTPTRFPRRDDVNAWLPREAGM